MRKLARVMLVTGMALAVFASFSSPAMAGTGAGAVTGTVNTDGIGGCTNGNPLCGKPQNNITFAGVLITGMFSSNDNSQQFVGSVAVGHNNTVTAKSTFAGGATLAQDAGTVFQFSVDDAVSATGNISNGSPVTGHLDRGCGGTYARVGSIVTVDLTCKFNINSTAVASNTTTHVTVVAQFTPSSGDGISAPVTQANFTGVYVGN